MDKSTNEYYCLKNEKLQQRFKITRNLLGKGTFGRVYEGIDQETNEKVAIKVIPIESADMDSLRSEVGILKKCDHENVIKCYGFYENNDEIFIITEMARGGELMDHIIKRKNFTEHDAI